MQEMVRAKVLKLLQAGIIYPIFDSTWVSPTQAVPKKSRVTTVCNEKGKEMPTRLTTSWRVCIDHRRLNEVTRKDHFPFPFYGLASRKDFRPPLQLLPSWLFRLFSN